MAAGCVVRTAVGETARDYCQRFPGASSRALGRMLCRDEPKLFPAFNAAYCSVRYARGAQGKRNGENCAPAIPRLELPQPEPNEWRIHELPKGPRYLVIGDTQIPFHDPQAIQTALRFGKQAKCNGVVMLGDIIEAHEISDFDKDPRNRDYATELRNVETFIEVIKAELKPKVFIWREGNHEHRLTRYLWRRAPEIFKIDPGLVSYENICKLADHGVEWVDWGHPITCGHLTLLHGDEWRHSAILVNPARTAFLRSLSCVLVAHSHRTSQHTENTVQGAEIVANSIGALCGLHPAWAPLARWNHGLAILETKADWKISNLRIVKGQVV